MKNYLKTINNKVGFTLIETLIYIGLTGLIMGAALSTVYELLQGGAKLNAKATIQSEANFVLRKINWAFSSVSNVIIIDPEFIKIFRNDGTEVDFCLDSSNPSKKIIKIRRGSIGTFLCSHASFFPITTQNVLINDLVFSQIGTNPIGVKASVAIGGYNFETTKYIRK